MGNAFITHACVKMGKVHFQPQKNGQGAFSGTEKRAGRRKVDRRKVGRVLRPFKNAWGKH